MAEATLVVMAAGIGSRYGGLKQIDPVGPGGEIIIDYSVFDARRAGFDKVVFIIRKEIESAFREKVGATIENQIETAYAFQELDMLPDGYALPADRTKPWGTGHALLCAADEIDGPFAAINADDFYGPTSFAVLADYLKQARDENGVYDWSMVGFILSNTLSEHGHVARGVCTVEDNQLVDIVERTKIQPFADGIKFSEDDGATWTALDSQTFVSMNMWGFTRGYLDELAAGFGTFLDTQMQLPKSEYLLPTIVSELLQQQRAAVKVLPCEEKWLGVTYQADKPSVVAAIRQRVEAGEYPERLWG
jgi:choline kinase